jgi:hypothetical protein
MGLLNIKEMRGAFPPFLTTYFKITYRLNNKFKIYL